MQLFARTWDAIVRACVPCLPSTPQPAVVQTKVVEPARSPTPLTEDKTDDGPKAMPPALLVYDIVSKIASYLERPDVVAFACTGNATIFEVGMRLVWAYLPSLRPLLTLLPRSVIAVESTAWRSRWSLYAPLVTSLNHDEADSRNAQPIPWALFQHLSSGHLVLLPSLQRLVWKCATARGALAIVDFISPQTLQQLDIGLSDYLDSVPAQQMLDQLASWRLHITICKLSLLEDSPVPQSTSPALLNAVTSLLRSIHGLREVHLSPALLSPSTIELLGTNSAALSTFTVTGRDAVKGVPEIDNSTGKLPFQRLETLETFHVDISTCSAILRSSAFPTLRRIRVWTTCLPSVDALTTFIAAAADIPCLEALLISVNAVIPLNHARYDYELPPTALYPLRNCQQLSVLELHLVWPTLITEEDALQMASAWPHLRILRMSGLVTQDLGYRSRLTLRVLLSFADHCMHLENLQLDINANLADIDMDALRRIDSVRRASIRAVDVGWSYWAPDGPSPEDVADFLSDVFPEDYFRLLWDHRLPAVVARRWNAVREFLTP